MKKLYIIAGEDSGDLHGSNLIKALRAKVPLAVRGIGGDNMQAQGVELVAHIKDTNFMGFVEILRNINKIRKLFRTIKSDIINWKPDAVVLIDYPGFNLRMAKFIHQLGIKVLYYISPQVWAWKKGRVKKIKKYTDRMLVILPFEQAFYAREGVEVDFVGHPLLDVIDLQTNAQEAAGKPIVALLPGSRKQEIHRMLPVMLALADHFPSYQFVIAGAPSQEKEFYQQLIGHSDLGLVMNQTYQLLAKASYAIVTSGTATLETALFRVPEIVCYKGSAISYFIGKRLVKVEFISLVNLILGRKAVAELIQYEYTVDKVAHQLKRLMQVDTQKHLFKDYDELREKLGNKGASKRAATVILEELSSL